MPGRAAGGGRVSEEASNVYSSMLAYLLQEDEELCGNESGVNLVVGNWCRDDLDRP